MMKKALVTLVAVFLVVIISAGCGSPKLTETQNAVCKDCDAEMQSIAEIASLWFSSETCIIDDELVYLITFVNTENKANDENAQLILNAAKSYCLSKLEDENMCLVVYYHNADNSKKYSLFDENKLSSKAVYSAIEK